MEIKANYHTHTNLCDGKNSPEEMVLAAIKAGLKHLGFSGHFDPDVYMDIYKYKKEIRSLQEKYRDRIDILLGAEVDRLFDVTKARDCEYIIGSTHGLNTAEGIISVDSSPEILQKLCINHFDGDYYKLTKAYYDLEATVVDVVKPDFIGHFDIVTKFNDTLHFVDEEDPRYLKSALDTLEHLCKYDIPFEINTAAYYRGMKKEMYPNMRILKALHDFGARIIISSDAHNSAVLTEAFDIAAEKAALCGFTSVNILVHDRNGHIAWEEVPLKGKL